MECLRSEQVVELKAAANVVNNYNLAIKQILAIVHT